MGVSRAPFAVEGNQRLWIGKRQGRIMCTIFTRKTNIKKGKNKVIRSECKVAPSRGKCRSTGCSHPRAVQDLTV